MNRSILIATLIVAAALVPVAFWLHDILALSMAALVPLATDLAAGRLK